jgi:hypothetical protein
MAAPLSESLARSCALRGRPLYPWPGYQLCRVEAYGDNCLLVGFQSPVPGKILPSLSYEINGSCCNLASLGAILAKLVTIVTLLWYESSVQIAWRLPHITHRPANPQSSFAPAKEPATAGARVDQQALT